MEARIDAKKPHRVMLYVVSTFTSLYSIWMLTTYASSSIAGVIWNAGLLAGAAGCVLKKRWAQYPIYAYTIFTTVTWVLYVVRYTLSKGWPYDGSTLGSVISLIPGIILCTYFSLSSVVVYRYFRGKTERPETGECRQ